MGPRNEETELSFSDFQGQGNTFYHVPAKEKELTLQQTKS
jgi:hypothetical protein